MWLIRHVYMSMLAQAFENAWLKVPGRDQKAAAFPQPVSEHTDEWDLTSRLCMTRYIGSRCTACQRLESRETGQLKRPQYYYDNQEVWAEFKRNPAPHPA